MKKTLSFVLMVLMLLTTVLGLAACGKTIDSGAIINTYYVGQMYDFDPARAAIDDDAMRVLSLLYEPLFTLDTNGKVIPALAEKYEIKRNEAEGEYGMEITLRATTWSDGVVVKADDVVYAWKRIIDASFASQAASLLYDIENAVEIKTAQSDENGYSITSEDLGAAAVNATTIAISFRKVYDEDGNVIEPDYDAFLRKLTSVSLAPVRQSVVEADNGKATDYWSKRSISIVTNGPFTVRTLNFEQLEFTLERNRYYKYANKDAIVDEPADKNVKPYQLITDWKIESEEMADLFASNSLFIMSDLPLSLREEMKGSAKVTDVMSTMSVLLNLNGYDNTENRGTALSYPAVRKALSDVVDRNEIAALLVYAKPATGFISHGVYEANNHRTEFSSAANALISAAATAGETVKEREDFKAAIADLTAGKSDRVKADLLTLTFAHNDTEADAKVAEYIKAAWESLGFTVILVPLTYNAESVELNLGDKDTQTLNYRASRLIDAFEDFAIKKDMPASVKVNPYDGKASTYLEAYRTGKGIANLRNNRAELRAIYFDALLMDYQMLSPDAFGPLASFSTVYNGNGVNLAKDADHFQLLTPYKNVTGYASEAYDALIEKAYNEPDAAKRAAILHDAEKLLLEDMPLIPLTFGQCYYVASKEISGISTTYYGYPVFTKTGLKNYQNYFPKDEEVTTAPETSAVTQ